MHAFAWAVGLNITSALKKLQRHICMHAVAVKESAHMKTWTVCLPTPSHVVHYLRDIWVCKLRINS